MLVNQEVKNLLAGVSQQPPIARHTEQLEEQINGLSNEIGGLQKRPPTVFIKELAEGLISKGHTAKVHFVNRDSTHKYLIAHNGYDEIVAWDIEGNPLKVKYEGEVRKYLQTDNPRQDLRLITIADYTFVVNRKIPTKMLDKKSTDKWSSQGVLVNIKEGQYGRTYKIIVNGSTVSSFTTPDGTKGEHVKQIDTNYIRDKLADGIGGSYKVQKGNSWLYITTTGKINSFSVEDGFNGRALKATHTSVKRYTDLPAEAPKGFTVLVKGENNADDDYYLEYDGSAWVETTKPNLKNDIDNTTMPIGIVSEADNSLTVKFLDWDSRAVGDEESNEEPSFIGSPITDIFYFRNRLGFLSRENVNLSRSGDYFNFWLESATDVLDTDPIDLQVSSTRISNLKFAVPYTGVLFLFSANSQFALNSDGVLTPKNAVIEQVADYESDGKTAPVGVGKNLYYISERLEHSSVNEYYVVNDSQEVKDSMNITAHVPNYIKNGVYEIVASPNEHIIGVLSEGDPSTMYIYKYLYLNGSKVQSSWSKWQFNGDIIGAEFIGSKLYLVLDRKGVTTLERMNIVYNTKDWGEEPVRTHIDCKRKVVLEGGKYDVRTRNYYYDVPKHLKGEKVLVLEDGRVFRTDSNTFKCPTGSNLDGLTAFIGETYPFIAELTQIALKQQKENITTPMPNYRLQLRDLIVSYAESGEFDVLVEYSNRETHKYKMTGRQVGLSKVAEHKIDTGSFRVPLHGKNTELKVTIQNNSPLPCGILGFTWSGNVVFRYRSI